jgi:hypothetical protein
LPAVAFKKNEMAMTEHIVRCLAVVTTVGFASAFAIADPPQRFDISPDNGRRDHLKTEWKNWLITPGRDSATSADGVAIEIRPTNNQSPLAANWWKAGLVSDACMASDGIYCDGPAAGLRLSIRGLVAGKHSLVTYHNSIWSDEVGPIDVLVNGVPAVTALQPTHRVTNDADAASAYVEFEATGATEVAVEIRPHAGEKRNEQALRRVILNGLELDAADPTKKALKPSPASGDEHVPQRPSLAWHAAKSAVAHDIYLGTDSDRVAHATRLSPEYRGRLLESTFAADAADTFATYYWRVDEVHEPVGRRDAIERIIKGDVWRFRVRHLAFPGAEGYGRFARGGRGGRVIKVTNLNDSGPGSLRAAVEAEGPRTVVFDVSGRIVLQRKLVIRNPYLTIAGQTAPGKGICVSNYNLGMLGAHDVVVRYLRVRPGDTAGVTLDGMGMASSDHCIIDHCSISWTQDEAFSSRAAKNITLQRTLISEALNVAGHKNYERGKQHGYAASIGGDIGSFHHNLLAHCAGRNWSLAGGLDKAGVHTGRLDIRNNVVYNWGHRTTDGGAMQVNFVNNYYKPGPATRVFHVLMPERNRHFGPQDYFVAGNVMEGRYGASEPLAGVVEPRNESMANFLVDAAFFEPHVTTQSAHEAYEDVLADVGCNLPMLDDHDRRVIEEVRAGTAEYKGSVSGLAGLPDSQSDVGGWEDYPEEHRPTDWDTDGDGMPSAWERQHGLDPNNAADGHLDSDADGYTNLEEFLNGLDAEDLTQRR